MRKVFSSLAIFSALVLAGEAIASSTRQPRPQNRYPRQVENSAGDVPNTEPLRVTRPDYVTPSPVVREQERSAIKYPPADPASVQPTYVPTPVEADITSQNYGQQRPRETQPGNMTDNIDANRYGFSSLADFLRQGPTLQRESQEASRDLEAYRRKMQRV